MTSPGDDSITVTYGPAAAGISDFSCAEGDPMRIYKGQLKIVA